MRGDFGTENTVVRDFQRAFRSVGEIFNVNLAEKGEGRNPLDSPLPSKSASGANTHNQRIERWWGQLRKTCMEYWIALFYTLPDNAMTAYLMAVSWTRVDLLQFCFMDQIQVRRQIKL